jgi:hypothetical protein
VRTYLSLPSQKYSCDWKYELEESRGGSNLRLLVVDGVFNSLRSNSYATHVYSVPHMAGDAVSNKSCRLCNRRKCYQQSREAVNQVDSLASDSFISARGKMDGHS